MIKQLFPSSIYYSRLLNSSSDRLNKELLTEAYQFANIDEAGHQWSEKNYLGGYTSYGSMAQLHRNSSTFEELEKEINKHVAKYVRSLEMDISPKELYMSSCWINIMPTTVTHSWHLHPLSVISGTYYVQTPKNCAGLKFEDPRVAHFMASPPRKTKAKQENQRYYTLKPEAKHVVLFESWMKHEVPPNQSESERISISFNYDWR